MSDVFMWLVGYRSREQSRERFFFAAGEKVEELRSLVGASRLLIPASRESYYFIFAYGKNLR